MKLLRLIVTLGLIMMPLSGVSAGDSASQKPGGISRYVVLVDSKQGALVAGAQSLAAMGNAAGSREVRYGVSLIEEFRAVSSTYLVLEAPDQPAMQAYLEEFKIKPKKVSAVEFVNSPQIGGGQAAGKQLRTGHRVFLIERKVPGAGSFPIEKKKKISMGSNAAIKKLGDAVEWDHSYLTNEGTFCAYRATDQNKIFEHAKLAGVPANRVSAVQHIVHGFDFGQSAK